MLWGARRHAGWLATGPVLVTGVLFGLIAGVAESQSQDQPNLLDPAKLAKVLTEPRFSEALTAALKELESLKAPYVQSRHQVFQPMDEVSQQRGVHGRVIFVMDNGQRRNGLEIFIYRAPDVAAAHIENLVVTPESRSADDSWSITSFNVKHSNAKTGIKIETRCGTAPIAKGARPLQIRCAYHPPESQIAVATYSYGTEVLEGMAVMDLAFASASLLSVAQSLATTEEARLRSNSVRPDVADFDALKGALGGPDYRRRFETNLASAFGTGEKWQAVAPFQEFHSGHFETSTNEERGETGIFGRGLYFMDGGNKEKGLEVVIFDDPAVAANTWKDLSDSEPGDLTTQAGRALSQGGEEHPIPCLYTTLLDGSKPTVLRCPHHRPGSRIVAVAFVNDLSPDPPEHDQPIVGAAAAVAFIGGKTAVEIERDVLGTSPRPVADTKAEPDDTTKQAEDDAVEPTPDLFNPHSAAFLFDLFADFDVRKKLFADRGNTLDPFEPHSDGKKLFPDLAGLDAGLQRRVRFPMSDQPGRAAFEVLTFEDATTIRDYLERTAAWPTADLPEATALATYSVDLPAGDDQRATVACRWPKDESLASLGTRCLYAPEGSRIVTVAHFKAERTKAHNVAAAIVAFDGYIAARYHATLPKALPALSHDLLGTGYLERFRAVFEQRRQGYESAGNRLTTFGLPRPALFNHADEFEFLTGLSGRIVVPMADQATTAGVELLVFDALAGIKAFLEDTKTWPELLLPLDMTFGRTWVTIPARDGGTVELACYTPFDTADKVIEYLGVRCVYVPEGSLLVSAAYYTTKQSASATSTAAVLAYDAYAAAQLAAKTDEAPGTVVDPSKTIGPGPQANCNAIVGEWRWFIGGMTSFAANGTARWKASPQALGRGASWTCDPATRIYSVAWDQGPTDSLTLAADGASLSGQNEQGVTVSAERYDAAAEAAAEQMAAALKVTPQMVGTWQLEVWLPTPQGPIPITWHIHPDGRYEIDAAQLSHSGIMEARDGKWTLESQTSEWRDGGTLAFEGWTAFVATGVLGPGRRHRFEPKLRVANADMGGEPVPGNVPELVTAAYQAAGYWRPDAKLVDLELDHEDQQKRKPSIKMRFHAPKSGAGLTVMAGPEGSRFFEHSAASWGGRGIPDGFLGLTEAWAIARQHGLEPPLGRASLRVYQPEGTEPVLAWLLASQRRGTQGIYIDGATGAKLEGDLTGYVEAYNTQWQQAIAGLKKLFARPAPRPSSGSGYSCCDFESSYDSGGSGDSGSSSSSNGTAAQNAWGSGDMQAYDRIMSGTATWGDKSRYGY